MAPVFSKNDVSTRGQLGKSELSGRGSAISLLADVLQDTAQQLFVRSVRHKGTFSLLLVGRDLFADAIQ